MNKKLTSFLILFAGFAAAMAIVRVPTFAASKPFIALERDPSSGLFTLTVSDPNGIKEFSLLPKDKSPYGGALGNCATVFKSDNVGYFSPDQFTPKMDATILDCQGNTVSIELPPLKDGATRGSAVSAPQTQTVQAPGEAENESLKIKPKSTVLAEIQFPVKELGNCQSEVECTSYCDDADHATACLDFAQKNNLLTPDEIRQKEKLASIGTGPGGCKSQASCETYCNDVGHIDECVAFGEAHGLLAGKDLEDAKKVQSAIARGKKLPGGCTGKKSCESYCNDADHTDECLAFAEDTGFLSQQEIQQYKTFSDFRKKGETPGGCTTKASCEAYCENPDNMEECLSFGEKTGFVSNEDAAMARKVLPLIKEGKTPGKCKTKDQCEAYCASEDHADECINFGLQAGMISQKDAEIIKKTGGKGPGECRGKDECRTYCNQNQQECINWAKANGLEGQFSGPGGAGGVSFSGPGGCKTPEECAAYCKDHPQECQRFAPPESGTEGRFFMPTPENGGTDASIRVGNCKNLQACKAYCDSHQEECQRLGVPDPAPCVSGIPEYAKLEQCQSYCSQHQEACDLSRYNYDVTKNSPHRTPGTPAAGYGEGFGRPGNCKSQEECIAYCKTNQADQLCKLLMRDFGGGAVFQEGSGNNNAGFSGPGGCKTPEECAAYCKDHPQECQNFGSGGGGSSVQSSSSITVPSQNQPENSQQIPQQVLPQNFPQIPPANNQIPQDYCSP
ncbi:hypothetical protein KGQ34_04215, partial [Patescibacteria group bacterium]|nr:hypothetical protein [Patescibacteria group bacterium]